MPTADMVAKLNSIGGKAGVGSLQKLRARPSDLFSPEKPLPRTLQRKDSSRATSSNVRRASLSLPDEHQNVSPLKPKLKLKKRTVLASSKSRDHGSPLKKHGYDVQLRHDPKVNLGDSPAKNTRSRGQNPLAALVNIHRLTPKVPSVDDSGQEGQEGEEEDSRHEDINEHDTRSKGPNEELETQNRGQETEELVQQEQQQEAPNNVNKRSLPQVNNITNSQATVPTSSKRGRRLKRRRVDDANQMNANGINVEQTQSQGPPRASEEGQAHNENQAVTEQGDGPGETLEASRAGDEQPVAKRSRGRPRKLKNGRDAAQTTEKIPSASAPIEAENTRRQNEEADQAAETEYRKCKEQFGKHIEKLIELHDCRDFWLNLGAAALTIRKLAHQSRPGSKSEVSAAGSSKSGQAVIRAISGAKLAYHNVVRQEDVAKNEEMAKRWLIAIGERCNALVSGSNESENRLVIRDMYLCILPQLVLLLKAFLRTKKEQQLWEVDTARDLLHLLSISQGVCRRICDWEPQPNDLDPSIESLTKEDIKENLKEIEDKFAPGRRRYEQMELESAAIADLAKRQAKAVEALHKRVAATNAHILKVARGVQSTSYAPPKVPPSYRASREDDEVIDIDDVDDIEDVEDVSRMYITRPTKTSRQLRELERIEPEDRGTGSIDVFTAENPPPSPISLSHEEKTALLNGLQQYTSRDRYARILEDSSYGRILKRRNVNDLDRAACSFSRMMVEKLGMEVYRADASLRWLSSIDLSP